MMWIEISIDIDFIARKRASEFQHQMNATIKDLPNKEEIILYPIKRMGMLFDSSNITIETVSDIPMDRFLAEMDKMWEMGVSYMTDGQIEKAAVLFLRYVSVNVDVLPKHRFYNFLEWEIRTRINERAKEGMEHTTKIRGCLGRLYEEESMRLFNDIIEKSKFGKTALEKFADGKTSFLDIVKDIRKMEKEELERNGRMLQMLPPEKKVEKTLAIPSDLVEKYKNAVGTNDLVGVLLGKNLRQQYCVVSHLLLPGKQHTGTNAEKFFHKVLAVSRGDGLMPFGLIHSCNDMYVCRRIKCRPAPAAAAAAASTSAAAASTSAAPARVEYPPPPLDHHDGYSACHHLFAQHLYQTINPFAVTIIANNKADNQCVWMTPAGRITAARRSLYNGEVTAKADHVKTSDAIQTILIDLRETEIEMKIDTDVVMESVEDRKENAPAPAAASNENAEN